jgi:DNA-3-methyladenine glycosylase I
MAATLRPRARCAWANGDPLMIRYHDREWGVPLHADRRLFELLILEGAQAGLSWSTILKKRDAYRRAFDRFDALQVAGYTERRVKRLLADAGIVRNRAKILATIDNARALLPVRCEHGSFDAYVWQFVGGAPVQNAWRSRSQVPAETDAARAMSRDLKRRGFGFVGPTICYAFMQATGMVNDHTTDCFRWRQLRRVTKGTR